MAIGMHGGFGHMSEVVVGACGDGNGIVEEDEGIYFVLLITLFF